MKILVSRSEIMDPEISLGNAFRSLGHETTVLQIKGPEDFVRIVETGGYDLSVQRCYSFLPFVAMGKLRAKKHKCRFVFWEKGWPRFLKLNDTRRKQFDVIFTACNDGTGILLPQASEDHSTLKRDNHYGLTLIAANKADPNPLWGATRINLHKRLNADLGNPFAGGLYNLHSTLNPYSKRFDVMANSWGSIAIWNIDFGVPLRCIEITSCGTPMFSYPYPELRGMYQPGVHYVEADNLKAAVQYYKSHPDELAKIAQAGYQHFRNNHMYVHRAKKILEVTFGGKK